jgi:hypothetical protein
MVFVGRVFFEGVFEGFRLVIWRTIGPLNGTIRGTSTPANVRKHTSNKRRNVRKHTTQMRQMLAWMVTIFEILTPEKLRTIQEQNPGKFHLREPKTHESSENFLHARFQGFSPA